MYFNEEGRVMLDKAVHPLNAYAPIVSRFEFPWKETVLRALAPNYLLKIC